MPDEGGCFSKVPDPMLTRTSIDFWFYDLRTKVLQTVAQCSRYHAPSYGYAREVGVVDEL